MRSVPDFFQDESENALRFQVEWLEQHLGLGDGFFARLLREDQSVFSAWRKTSAALEGDKEAVLRDWWRTVLHLLSFQNFDPEKVRTLLEQTAPAHPPTKQAVFAPPWCASSLKAYLETHGRDAIAEVDRWVESFRFGEPNALPRKEASFLSIQP